MVARYYEEIKEEGKVLSYLNQYFYKKEFLERLEDIDIEEVDKIIFTGMGSSYFALFPGIMYLNQHNISAYAIPANKLLYYYKNLVKENTLLVFVSQSGESIEIKELLNIFKDHSLKLGVTNTYRSTLAKNLDRTLFLNAGEEKSTTSKTYLNTLAMVLKVCTIFTKEEIDFKNISEKVDFYLKNEKRLIDIFSSYFLGTNYIALLGRGPSLSTVYQGALILKEAAHFYAEGFDTSDFRHGPLDMVSSGFRAIIFSPYDNDEAFEKDVMLSEKIVSQGGYILFITNRKLDKRIPIYTIDVENPFLLPFLEIIPLQLMSCKIAWAKGIEPGTLTNIGKVVVK